MKQLKRISTKISKDMKAQTKAVNKVEKSMSKMDFTDMWQNNDFRKRFRILMRKPQLTQAPSLEV